MNLEKTNAQMKKGVLELCILAIIEKEDVYASDILDRLKEARLIVVEGTLYPLLNRLKNEGMLKYRWEESRSGPPRKYYMLTEVGIKMLGELTKDYSELRDSVDRLINK